MSYLELKIVELLGLRDKVGSAEAQIELNNFLQWLVNKYHDESPSPKGGE